MTGAPRVRTHVYRPYDCQTRKRVGDVCAFNGTCGLSKAAHVRAVREDGHRAPRVAPAVARPLAAGAWRWS